MRLYSANLSPDAELARGELILLKLAICVIDHDALIRLIEALGTGAEPERQKALIRGFHPQGRDSVGMSRATARPFQQTHVRRGHRAQDPYWSVVYGWRRFDTRPIPSATLSGLTLPPCGLRSGRGLASARTALGLADPEGPESLAFCHRFFLKIPEVIKKARAFKLLGRI